MRLLRRVELRAAFRFRRVQRERLPLQRNVRSRDFILARIHVAFASNQSSLARIKHLALLLQSLGVLLLWVHNRCTSGDTGNTRRVVRARPASAIAMRGAGFFFFGFGFERRQFLLRLFYDALEGCNFPPRLFDLLPCLSEVVLHRLEGL